MKPKPKSHRWYLPGLGLKRWAVLGGVAIALIIIGAWSMVNNQYVKAFTFAFVNFLQRTIPDLSPGQGLICVAIGILAIVFCFRNFSNQYGRISKDSKSLDDYYTDTILANGPKIVVIGGGTGLSVLLKGLKHHTSNITAAVSVGDDGGSSGRLRREFDVVPVGDIRSCVVALADEENVMEKVFNYRFSRGEGLKGHSLGNLLLLALASINGNFQDAVANIDQILHIRGRVVPITTVPLILKAEMMDGSFVEGECNIGESDVQIKHLAIDPPYAEVSPTVLEAIDEADAVILGPGSLYTSVIPNLCVHQVVEAIRESKCKTFYICNVTQQPGETTNYKASDHLQAIYDHSCSEMIDYMLVDNGSITTDIEMADILLQASARVEVDHEALEQMGVKLIETSLVSKENPYHHDSNKLSEAIMKALYSDTDYIFKRGIKQIYWDYQRTRQEKEARD